MTATGRPPEPPAGQQPATGDRRRAVGQPSHDRPAAQRAARPVRGRDALGRRVPLDSPAAVPDVPEQALPPLAALALAQSLLGEGRAFGAHEVLEASWKAAPGPERRMWQALAQLCVGLTHWQRGNRVGAARLLRRAAQGLAPDLPYGLDPQLGERALHLAGQVEAGGPVPPTVRLRSG